MRTTTLMLATLAAGCSTEPLSLTVDAVVGEASVHCGDSLTVGGAVGRVADLKWFLSSPRALVDGEEVPLAFVEDGTWQVSDIALIDLEDATADCAAQGSEATNDQLVFTAESAAILDDAEALVLTLGVPFDRNHRDPAAEPPPMNDPTTFWAWQSGYKFVRLDLLVGDEDLPWNLHLGSTGCTSDGATQAPTIDCTRPNRARVELPWTGSETRLTLDLAEVLRGTDLRTNAPDSPPGCMANPRDIGDCEPVFEAFGLDFATGACIDDCVDQTAFNAQ